MRIAARTLIPILLLALGGCATLPPEIPESAACRADYLGLDQKVAQAGARNGGAHRIDGFPYLRSNRFLASFRDEAVDGPKFDAWVARLRALDLEARASELRNVGWSEPAEELRHLDRCGKAWAERDLADPQRRALLRRNVEVPDDYSMLSRVAGLYPFAVPFLRRGIGSFNETVAKDYATPAAELKSPGKLVLWSGTPPQATPRPKLSPPDALGIGDVSAWFLLAQQFQPHWLIETGGEFDEPGAIRLGEQGPGVDIARPVTYVLPAFTRLGDKVLFQLVYFVWFTERPKHGALDSYAGTLDGVVWRVTFDTDGEPLVYDTVHACGCYHYYFPARPLQRKPQGGFWQEPVLMPQDAPRQPFAIRLQSGTHYVRRLVPLGELPPVESRQYALDDYHDLLSLPAMGGGTRSLFDEDGLVRGTERFERFWLWPAGVKSAGAMRQWGRHATSFVGRSHFDDPEMLDRLFEK